MNKLMIIKTKIEENIFFKIARAVLYAFVALLLVVIIVQKVTRNNLSIGGVAKKVPAEEINIGDNVTYLGEKNQLKGLIITHKVVEKRETGDETYYITRGLANNVSDPEISYDQIYGKVVYKTILLSFIAKLMNNQLSYYILFTLVALIISLEIVSSLFIHDDDEKEGSANKGRK